MKTNIKTKKKIRIGDIAQQLQVEHFVIRFWEKEFNLSAKRSAGGQRYYTKADVTKLETIKKLLYEKGYTISGAKKFLQKKSGDILLDETIVAASKIVPQKPTEQLHKTELDNTLLNAQILDLQKKLIKLRDLL